MNKLELHEIKVLNNEKKAILEIDKFFLQEGELLGIKGPSGAGKSTFLHLISGIIKAVEGKVLWNKKDLNILSEAKRDEFRKDNIGMIFQNYYLFEELDIFDNVSITASFNSKKAKKIKENTYKYLEFFNLNINDKRAVSSYSGGERQRIAVARALSCEPEIIIADEPTASLDKTNAFILIKDLIKLAKEKNKTLIVVSHDESLLEKMNRIISIENGKIKEDIK